MRSRFPDRNVAIAKGREVRRGIPMKLLGRGDQPDADGAILGEVPGGDEAVAAVVPLAR